MVKPYSDNTMEKEKQYLITLCRAYLTGTAIVLDETIRYDRLYQLANAHNISAILFCVINTAANRQIVPAEAFTQFQNDFYEAVIRYEVQSRIMQELTDCLTQNGIRHVFFKGAEIRTLYPVPQARVMGDIDVLIDKQNRETVRRLLQQHGFACLSANGPVYNYRKENVIIEMHTQILNGKVGNSQAPAFFADAITHAVWNGYRGELPPAYHFAYLLAHIAHHFWFHGAGIKLLLDLAVCQQRQEIEEETLLPWMATMELETFAKEILAVCRKWFGDTAVATVDTPTAKTEQFLLSYGAFGNINRRNATVVARKQLEEGKSGNSKWQLLFPSYEKLKHIPYIRFIEGRPYLLPLAWCYRLWYHLLKRNDFMMETVRDLNSDENKKEAETELAYFKEIGLL